MKSPRHSAAVAILVFTLAIWSGMAPSFAQRDDIGALNKQYQDYYRAGNYPDALVAVQKLEVAVKVQFGPYHEKYAFVLAMLAKSHGLMGRYGEEIAFSEGSLAVYERAHGANSSSVTALLDNMADTETRRGNYGEAEKLVKRAIEIDEKARGSNYSGMGSNYSILARIYLLQSRFDAAVPLYQRALAIVEKTKGPSHPDVAFALSQLAFAFLSQGRFGEAEALCKRAIAINERISDARKARPEEALGVLARAYLSQGRSLEAETLMKRVVSLLENSGGFNSHSIGLGLSFLAKTYQAQRKFGEAQDALRRALPMLERTAGVNHPDVANVLNDLALLEAAQGNSASALAWSRKSTLAVITHAAFETPGTHKEQAFSALVDQRTDYFRNHVAHLATAAQKGTESIEPLGREAFDMAQWASHSSTALAVQRMAARFASSSGLLAAIARESQDLTTLRRDLEKALIEILSRPQNRQTSIDSIRRQVTETESKLAAINAKLIREFPTYASLVRLTPLKAENVRQLLASDEALLFFLTGDSESYVFALTGEGFQWNRIPLDSKELARKVGEFRRGLDVDAFEKSLRAGKPELFDLNLAYELHAALIGPVESLVKDKRNLYVVPTGALTALPVHLLVTQRPNVARPLEISGYRDAAWLLKRHAIVVLPSVASLKALRALGTQDRAAKPMVGFGDPVFDAEEGMGARSLAKGAFRNVTMRAYTDFWQGAGVDRAKLAQALPRLEDTADELMAVARQLGAPDSDIYLRAGASETTVKRLRLSDYRVVYFATHGLVAGDVKGLGEPSLALTLPKTPSEVDDGLLTASEVAQLKLNADWVVLSACNTIAGDKPGAEALSGLARAFFYAGARALLVSHWAVESAAATRLTTSTFDLMKSDPKLGRAEALRRAMMDYMNDTSRPENAYPAFWAPFMIVGEGAVQ